MSRGLRYEFRVCLGYDRAREAPGETVYARFEAAQSAVAEHVRTGRKRGRVRRACIQRRPLPEHPANTLSPLSAPADRMGMAAQSPNSRWEVIHTCDVQLIERILEQTAQEAGIARRTELPASPGLRIRWSQYRRCRYLMGGTTLLLIGMLGSFASWQAHAAPISSIQLFRPPSTITHEIPFSPADLRHTRPAAQTAPE